MRFKGWVEDLSAPKTPEEWYREFPARDVVVNISDVGAVTVDRVKDDRAYLYLRSIPGHCITTEDGDAVKVIVGIMEAATRTMARAAQIQLDKMKGAQ